MIKKVLMLFLPVLGLVSGLLAGEFLRPVQGIAATESDQVEIDDKVTTRSAWFTFPSQFFVPLIRGGDMSGIMILTLTLEVGDDALSVLEREEHRLRDALLRQLMRHANTGGFLGNYTAEDNLRRLSEGLLDAVQKATEVPVRAVLIQDIVRQVS